MFYYTEITRNRHPWATWLPVPRGLLWRSTSVASKSKGVHFLASSGWQSTRPGMECEYCNIICVDCNESKGLAVDVTGQERDRTMEFEVATVASLGRHHMLLFVT